MCVVYAVVLHSFNSGLCYVNTHTKRFLFGAMFRLQIDGLLFSRTARGNPQQWNYVIIKIYILGCRFVSIFQNFEKNETPRGSSEEICCNLSLSIFNFRYFFVFLVLCPPPLLPSLYVVSHSREYFCGPLVHEEILHTIWMAFVARAPYMHTSKALELAILSNATPTATTVGVWPNASYFCCCSKLLVWLRPRTHRRRAVP